MDFSDEGDGMNQNILNSENSEDKPKSTFHCELQEAMWLALESGMTMAEILGDVRRAALSSATRRHGGDKKVARKALGISVTTLYRIENGGNKF